MPILAAAGIEFSGEPEIFARFTTPSSADAGCSLAMIQIIAIQPAFAELVGRLPLAAGETNAVAARHATAERGRMARNLVAGG